MTAEIGLVVVTSVLGLLTAAVLALVNSWVSARAGIDEDLREKRLAVYPALWNGTATVSRWPRQVVTRTGLAAFHESMRDWYYGDGGLFLSLTSRARYGDVQELVAALLAVPGGPHDRLVVTAYDSLGDAASALRTALTEDLDTRRRPSWLELRRRARRHEAARSAAATRLAEVRTSSPWAPDPQPDSPPAPGR